MSAPITLQYNDSTGKAGTEFSHFVDLVFRHTGNDKYYRVIGLVYDGESDMWSLSHVEVDPVTHDRIGVVAITRPHTDFFGLRQGQRRYVQVTRLSHNGNKHAATLSKTANGRLIQHVVTTCVTLATTLMHTTLNGMSHEGQVAELTERLTHAVDLYETVAPSGAPAEPQRTVVHLTVGDENWEPTGEELQSVVSLFQSIDLDPLGGVLASRPGIKATVLNIPANGVDYVATRWEEKVGNSTSHMVIAPMMWEPNEAEIEGLIAIFLNYPVGTFKLPAKDSVEVFAINLDETQRLAFMGVKPEGMKPDEFADDVRTSLTSDGVSDEAN